MSSASLPTKDWTGTTCDLYDEYLDQAQVTSGIAWRHFGGKPSFAGRAVTIQLFEDNSRLKECVETNCATVVAAQQAEQLRQLPRNTVSNEQGEEEDVGTILVVDAGASMRCAVLGDQLVKQAVANDYQGILIYGCVRDAAILATLDIGICALGTTPRKSTRRGQGQVSLPVPIGNVTVQPGDYVFVDLDGVLVLDPRIVHARRRQQQKEEEEERQQHN